MDWVSGDRVPGPGADNGCGVVYCSLVVRRTVHVKGGSGWGEEMVIGRREGWRLEAGD